MVSGEVFTVLTAANEWRDQDIARLKEGCGAVCFSPDHPKMVILGGERHLPTVRGKIGHNHFAYSVKEGREGLPFQPVF